MRHVPHAEGRGHVGDLLALGEPARRARIRLHDVDRPAHEHLAEAPARELALPARNRDRLAAAHLDIAVEIIRHDRLLEPADVLISHGAAERNGLQRIETMVRIEHKTDLRPDRLAHGANKRSILLDAEADLELDRLEALADIALHLLDHVVERIALAQTIGAGRIGIHGRPVRAAEQHRGRHIEVPPLEIEERDVDAADRRNHHALLTVVAEVVVEIHPDDIGRAWVAPDQAALQRLDDRRVDARRPIALAPAGRPRVRRDLDEAARANGCRGE